MVPNLTGRAGGGTANGRDEACGDRVHPVVRAVAALVLRLMHTKMAQWRYMHLVQLDELSSAGGAACSEVVNLAQILEAKTAAQHELEMQQSGIAEGPLGIERARPVLELLQDSLSSTTTMKNEVCN